MDVSQFQSEIIPPNGTVSKKQIPPEADELKLVSEAILLNFRSKRKVVSFLEKREEN